VIAAVAALAAGASPASGAIEGQVSATDQFEYSYQSETRREIFENWLDVSYLFGSLRTGVLLNSRSPSEEGDRANELRHRFVEFSSDDLVVRAGHFYGLFGRGLLFAAYEDRTIRVDTALDGLMASGSFGPVRGAAFSGTPSGIARDIRGADIEADLGRSLSIGGSGLTYQAPGAAAGAAAVNREWVAAGRLSGMFSFGDAYLECGWKKGYDFETALDDEAHPGRALYGSVNIAVGPVALAVEGKDYDRFAVLPRADGRVTLNNPPALTREHGYTLLSRNAHNLDPDDEVGAQAEITVTGPSGWDAIVNANRTRNHDGDLLFEEAYASLEKERFGDFRVRGAFGYQDSEGLHQLAIGEATWFADPVHAVTVQAQHEHVRLEGGPDVDLGAFDQQLYGVEISRSPHWTVTGLIEVNNKYPEQRFLPGEKKGPFPAIAISYASSDGSAVTLWAGKRQAGRVCTGGVCKFEPAFEGIELAGTLRY
jgi:hypothetical protein